MADPYKTRNRRGVQCCDNWPHRGRWCPIVAVTAVEILADRPDLDPDEPSYRAWAYQQAAQHLNVAWTQDNADQYGMTPWFAATLARTVDNLTPQPHSQA